MTLSLPHDANPFFSLAAIFLGWKSFLLAIALGAAIGSDYDTSTSIFFEHTYGSNARVPTLAARLTRWDALYFTYASRKGYVFEQQWAFGPGLPFAVRLISRLLQAWGVVHDGASEPLVAIIMAHVTHFLAALALYKLTALVFNDRKLAYVTSVLHIMSPAGLFLSAPYSESPFACLSFLGYLLLARGLKDNPTSLTRNGMLVGAGLSFGLSTTFRSNGLLNGVLFAVETLRSLRDLSQNPRPAMILACIAPIIGGLCVAAGSLAPQAMAWVRFCHTGLAQDELRPWCSRTLPSIYTFVQEHYWNNGFLRYWTPAQIPLFLLASPMLIILIKSSLSFLRQNQGPAPRDASHHHHHVFVRTLAAIQLAVAILAITNFHVQIVTRLSSGYPVWYWWVADCLGNAKLQARGSTIVVFIIMYASVQGALFASFLPPA